MMTADGCDLIPVVLPEIAIVPGLNRNRLCATPSLQQPQPFLTALIQPFLTALIKISHTSCYGTCCRAGLVFYQ